METTNYIDKLAYTTGQESHSENYWINLFSGERVISGFPYDHKKIDTNKRLMKAYSFKLGHEYYSQLMKFSNGSHLRLHMLLIAAMVSLLFKYSGNNNITVGTSIYKQETQGEFINTVLPMQHQLEGNTTFKELVLQVRATIAGAVENQNFPIELILEKSGIPFGKDDDFPLFDIAVLLENIQDRTYLQHINTNMFFYFSETGEYVDAMVEYNSSLYKKETIERVIAHFKHLLHQVLFNFELKLAQINILTQEEKRQLLIEFNHTAAAYPKDLTITELFQRQAEKTPDHIAVIHENHHLTYNRLNRKANQLTRILREKGVKADSIVGLMTGPSLHLVIGILGILKARAAYLPLDPENPETRTLFILKDSSTRVIVLQGRFLNENIRVLQHISPDRILALDDDNIYSYPEETNRHDIDALHHLKHMAYIIYTSGTTGKPKGVIIDHQGLVNYIWWAARHYVKNERVNFPLFTSISFDLTVTSIFTPLITGNAIVVYGDGDPDKAMLIEKIIEENKVGVVKLTPSHLRLMRENPIHSPAVKRYIVGGEELDTQLAADISGNSNHEIEIYNEYGPTETVVGCMCYRFNPGTDTRQSVPIGVPIDNMQVFILDAYGCPVPPGAVGELHIAGDGVARGYLNQPELTQEKFKIINNNLKTKTQSSHLPIYRTGDLACWLSDGNIEFLGRIDHQVKIRGYRIELSEIESLLKKHPDIKEAVVTANGENSEDRNLCAYVVPRNSDSGLPTELTSTELKEYLSQKLPDYMIPSHFLNLAKLPLTSNGKIDRKVLPEPGIQSGFKYVAPRNPLEEKLVEIWSDVLGLEKDIIGIDTNFFELGGNSLKATVLIVRIHKALDVKLPLAEVFKTTNIKGLAEYINKTGEEKFISLRSVEKKDYYPMSSAQKRLYILQQMEMDNIAYNIPLVSALEGKWEAEKMEETFRKLIDRHEGLRTSFIIVNEEPIQKILPVDEVEFAIVYYESVQEKERQEREEEGIIRDFVRPFDLSRAPLLRVGVIKRGEERTLLMVDMHHIIADGISMDLVTKEFATLYAGEELPPLRLQYKDFLEWQNSEKQKKVIKKQEEYWLKQFEGEIPVLNLPNDFARPVFQGFEGGGIQFHMTSQETRQLKEMAAHQDVTLFMALMAIFAVFLAKVTGQENVIVGTGAAGRRHWDLQQVLGIFVNTLVVRNYPEKQKSFRDFLKEVKKTTLETFENQEYPFEELVEKIEANRDTSRNPLFDVMLMLQNVEHEAAEQRTKIASQGMNSHLFRFSHGTSKFDLTLFAIEGNDMFYFFFEYSTRLFKRQTIDLFIIYFKEIAAAAASDPDRPLLEIESISAPGRKQIIYQLNRGLRADAASIMDTIRDKTLQQELKDSFEKFNTDTAIAYGRHCLTYGQLDRQSNFISNWMIDKGILPGMFIGVLLENRLDIIAAMIAILKTRCVFVPLDTSYPEGRLAGMIRSAGLQFVLTHSNRMNENGEVEIIKWDHLLFHTLPGTNQWFASAPRLSYRQEDDIYIYFTSGTTGVPRAILGRNRSLLHFIHWEIRTFAVDKTWRFTQLTTPVFDAFLRDTLVPLSSGAAICIPGNKDIMLEPGKLTRWVQRSHIYLIHCVPAIFRLLKSRSHITPDYFKDLRFILLSGERINPSDLVEWYDTFGERIQLVNLWGTSETTLAKTYYFIRPEDTSLERIPVGTPLPGACVVVLNENREVCDQLVTGELYIKTPFRTAGYCNDPELTDARFIAGFLPGDPGGQSDTGFANRLHKTGDLGRLLPDGNIDVLGRNDRQVKIRGIRLELEEIESFIMKHPLVSDAVVVKKEVSAANEVLCAYVCGAARNETPIDSLPGALESYLAGKLPAYMVPNHILLLEKIPRKPNGKVDYERLPHPLRDRPDDYAPPRDEVEKRLAAIWKEVLGIEKIGMNQQFFEWGGNSLHAMSLIAKIHKEFDIRMPLGEFFNRPTAAKQAEFIREGMRDKCPEDRYASIKPTEQKEYYPQSSAQKRLYILHQLELNGNMTAYNMPMVVLLEGELALQKLEQTFQKIIHRHESLRTSFGMINGIPIQRIHEDNNLDFNVSLYESGEQEAGELVNRLIKSFNLAEAPLMRVSMIKIGDTRHILMVDMHHIISDGVSLSILEQDFMWGYEGNRLAPLRLQYKDYSEWKNSNHQREKTKQQEGYWLNKFSGEIPLLNLSTDFTRPPFQDFEGSAIAFELGKDETAALRRCALEEETTLFTVLLSIYHLLLSKISNQEDIVVGIPTAGRRHVDLEQIMGMFVNTLALRNYSGGGKNFQQFLEEVNTGTLEAFDNQDYQYEELVERVAVTRDTGRNPLFDVFFVLQNIESPPVDIPGLILKPYNYNQGISKFDLTLQCSEIGDKMWFNFQYSTKLFRKETIERLILYFKKILSTVVKEVEIKISRICIVSEEEKKQVLYDFNNTKKEYPAHKTILELFAEEVERSRDSIAVVGPGPGNSEKLSLTYMELNQKSLQLAGVLRERGVKSDTIVGIMVERSIEMIIGILGILNSGGAYLPIDHEYPLERIDYMLADSSAKVLATASPTGTLTEKIEKLKGWEGKRNPGLVFLDSFEFPYSSSSHPHASSPSSLAYVIYTSGTTGKPRGVMVEHGNALNVVWWFANQYHLKQDSHVLQMSEYTFDPSVNQVFGTLIRGAVLYLVTKEVLFNVELLRQYIQNHQIHLVNFVPQLLYHLLGTGPKLKSIKVVICGGEQLTDHIKESILGKGYALYNQYGPTETTVDATMEKCSKTGTGNIIGKPIANVRCYLVDKNNQLSPLGVTGELWVAGDGVARGYLNRPELTAEKFTRNVFAEGRFYRTGDLGKWHFDGNIEFLGRIDHQVKIRGFRIELGEIDSHLMNHKEIKEAMVMQRTDAAGDNYLCAYIVSDKELVESELKEYLSGSLPDYMVPTSILQIEKFPLTPSGKVDRNALPLPEATRGSEYVAPRDEIENTLAGIWAEVLGIEKSLIGIDDNFFQKGGHSLKATRLVYLAHQQFETKIELRNIFTHSTIRKLATLIKKSGESKYLEILPQEEREYYDLSHAQRRLWIICQFEEESSAYNLADMTPFSGEINVHALKHTVQSLVDRHQSLRTAFITVDEQPKQKIIKNLKFNLEPIDLRHLDTAVKQKKIMELYQATANKAFDLGKAPLFELLLFRLEEQEWAIVFNIHHIITDGWSQSIMENELITLYNASSNLRENPIKPLKIQYKEYTLWHNKLVKEGSFNKAGKYWLEKLNDKPNGIELPFDHPRKVRQTFNGGTVGINLDKESGLKLHQLSLEQDITLFMSIVSIFSIFLFHYTNQRDIILGVPIAGRQKPELHDMMGFLVNTLVLRNEVNPEENFKQLVKAVKKETLDCYENQDYPFDVLVEQLNLDRDLSQSPLFNVMLAYDHIGIIEEKTVVEGISAGRYSLDEDYNMSLFDLILFINKYRNYVIGSFMFNSDLFERSTIERMAKNFKCCIKNVLDSPGMPIGRLNYLDEAEYAIVVRHFNDNHHQFSNLSVQELFENQAEKNKDATAVVYNEQHITYGDLNKRINRLAHHLRDDFNIQRQDIIGIAMDRSLEMIITLWGIIKSGAGYVAIDPNYPEERILHMLSDSRVDLLIIDDTKPQLFQNYEGKTINFHSLMDQILQKSGENLKVINEPSDVLYVIYTSGTTGTPNGAMLSHGILTNLVKWQREKTSIDSSTRCLQFTSINFCVSFQEIIITLTSGGEVHLIGDIERQDINYFMDFLTTHKIEVLYLPFSYLNFLFNESGRWGETFKNYLKHIITAGEQLKITVGLKRFLDLNPHIKLHNHYGSSEMHVVTSYTLDASSAAQTPVPPAGKPIANTNIYILDEYHNPVPIGVWGELCIAGSHEVLGYMDNENLTNKKLLKHPLLSPGKRLYRSGDIGRWLEDGNIELRGRADSQVKVRGFRIELSEIESKILSIQRVKDCVVVVKTRENAEKYLLAYIVVEDIEVAEIKRIISQFLPLYMIPKFVVLERLPLMPNGKVDREKLPEPLQQGGGIEALSHASREGVPRDEVEEKLAEIWADILEIEKHTISIEDNFFELGGHSLKATILAAKIHKVLNTQIPLVEIFRTPTIRELAQYIKKTTTVRYISIEPVEKKKYYALSSAQKRLYTFQQSEINSTVYNMLGFVILSEEPDLEKIEETFNKLINRHESLRTSFHMIDNQPVQEVHTEVEFSIQYFVLKDGPKIEGGTDSIAEISQHLDYPFDLSRAPLLRVGIIKREQQGYLLGVVMHHIISDGISHNILEKDFMALYNGSDLPRLRLQYKDFSQWQHNEKNKETVRKQEQYWLNHLNGEIPVLNLPTDSRRLPLQSFKGSTVDFNLDSEETKKLKTLTSGKVTLFMVLLATYYILLSKICNQEDVIIGIPVMGRKHIDLETIIGMFVNMLALRNFPQGEKTFMEFLIELKERALESFENQDYQFDDLVPKIITKRDISRNPIFDTVFSFHTGSPGERERKNPGPNSESNGNGREISHFDLMLLARERGDSLGLAFEYSTDLFKKETIEKMKEYFLGIVKQITGNINIKLKHIIISHDLVAASSTILKEEIGGYDF
jgi:tyrocidine synthetase-3